MKSEPLNYITEVNTEQGNLINSTTTWNLIAELVSRVDVPLEEVRRQKKANKNNAFLPVPKLTKEEALDLWITTTRIKITKCNMYSLLIDPNIYFYRTAEEQDVRQAVWSGHYDNGRL